MLWPDKVKAELARRAKGITAEEEPQTTNQLAEAATVIGNHPISM
ncbi:MAG TPA: hypothetical protein VKA68_19325 [bacterium]|nr:hypothetical protein [bacterium]